MWKLCAYASPRSEKAQKSISPKDIRSSKKASFQRTPDTCIVAISPKVNRNNTARILAEVTIQNNRCPVTLYVKIHFIVQLPACIQCSPLKYSKHLNCQEIFMLG